MTLGRLGLGLLTVLSCVGLGATNGRCGQPSNAPERPVLPGLASVLAGSRREDGRYAVWVFFADKGVVGVQREAQLNELRAKLSPRSVARRSRTRAPGRLVDHSDLPVCPGYVRRLAAAGLQIRTLSRWLNAASVWAEPRQIEAVVRLPFVRAVQPVYRFRRRSPQLLEEPPVPPAKGSAAHTLDYGDSYPQLAQIHVPELHDAGLTGEGIRICILDAGFDQLAHEAFAGLRVVGTWDFLEGDADVSGDAHGSQVLSVLGGYKQGELVGTAFNAEFLLARTEDTRNDQPGWQSDTPVEEDYWIAGIEWAEQMDAEVVSSSLGYTQWDDGTGYTWDDLNGDIARTTVAADIAASKGLVVVVSAGNEGNTDWQRITTPADGDSVIAVGAVDGQGVRPSFSSVGPTSDGRIKPDVVAIGVRVCAIHTFALDAYTYCNGASFSCPLVSGVCALLLQAHPDWGPYEVAEALRTTAADLGPAGPDTLYGWGLVNALAASGLVSLPHVQAVPDGRVGVGELYTLTPSATGTLPITWSLSNGPYGMEVDSTTGTVTWTPTSDQIGSHRVALNARNTAGTDTVSWGVLAYVPVAVARFGSPYPNPSTSGTVAFPFDLPSESEVSLRVFTLAGELVWERFGLFGPGPDALPWNEVNGRSHKVGSGVYLYRIRCGTREELGKIAIIR